MPASTCRSAVHEDMAANFGVYPKAWGLTRPDRNIDHRRVPNLETFFRRKGGARTLSKTASDYLARRHCELAAVPAAACRTSAW